MPAGRPPKYKTADELQKVIDKYFEVESEKPTVTGLAYHLGFETRQAIYHLENKNNELSYTIKRAVLKIESVHERGLQGNSNAGHIFWLKNRGWRDTQQIDQNTNITIQDGTELGLP